MTAHHITGFVVSWNILIPFVKLSQVILKTDDINIAFI